MKKTNNDAVKLTLQDLINKKLQKYVYELKYENIYASKIDGKLPFRVPNETEMFETMDGMAEDKSMANIKQVYIKLIFRQCDMLHEKELLAAYNIKRGFDIVEILFSTQDILDIGNKFISESDFSEKEEAIKN